MAMEYLQDGISDAQRELSSPLFDLTEPSHDILSSDSSSTIEKSLNDVLSSDSSPTIDIVQSFSPIPHSLTISAKFFLAFWVWASLGASIHSYDEFSSFWLAYFIFDELGMDSDVYLFCIFAVVCNRSEEMGRTQCVYNVGKDYLGTCTSLADCC